MIQERGNSGIFSHFPQEYIFEMCRNNSISVASAVSLSPCPTPRAPESHSAEWTGGTLLWSSYFLLSDDGPISSPCQLLQGTCCFFTTMASFFHWELPLPKSTGTEKFHAGHLLLQGQTSGHLPSDMVVSPGSQRTKDFQHGQREQRKQAGLGETPHWKGSWSYLEA